MYSIVCSLPAPTFYYLERELLFNNKVRNLPQTFGVGGTAGYGTGAGLGQGCSTSLG